MSYYMKSLILFLVLASVFEGGKTEIKSRSKVTVQIVNGLSENQLLTFHCQSKDDDLGTHIMKNSAVYSFSFFPRIIGKTLFYCNFWWPTNFSSVHHFDIYDQYRDRCVACIWHISESGPCLENDGSGKKLCLPFT